jgi:predicted nucleic acid-binding protein
MNSRWVTLISASLVAFASLVIAWQVYRKLSKDQRVAFLHEPSGIEEGWRRLTQGGTAATNTWTDAYLCAFASIRNLQIVSFDSGLRGTDATILHA